MATPSKRTIYSLQMLRFAAALIVVVDHVGARMQSQATRYHFPLGIVDVLGSFGVRLFFVISGFIMVWICFKNGADEHPAPGKFLLNRIQRIVPLYWICTTVNLLYYTASSHLGDPHAAYKLKPLYILQSYFFIPAPADSGRMRPLLDVGWTLNYEMFFYAVFALGLFARGSWGVALAAVALAAAVTLAAPSNYILAIWTSNIILYFIAGMLIGAARVSLHRRAIVLPKIPGAVPIAFALSILGACSPWILTPALAIAAVALCALSADREPNGAIGHAMVRMGDASFSLYLVHGFVLLFVGILWRKILAGSHVWAFGAVEIVLSLAAGWLLYRYVEIHVGDFVASRFPPRRADRAPTVA